MIVLYLQIVIRLNLALGLTHFSHGKEKFGLKFVIHQCRMGQTNFQCGVHLQFPNKNAPWMDLEQHQKVKQRKETAIGKLITVRIYWYASVFNVLTHALYAYVACRAATCPLHIFAISLMPPQVFPMSLISFSTVSRHLIFVMTVASFWL